MKRNKISNNLEFNKPVDVQIYNKHGFLSGFNNRKDYNTIIQHITDQTFSYYNRQTATGPTPQIRKRGDKPLKFSN